MKNPKSFDCDDFETKVLSYWNYHDGKSGLGKVIYIDIDIIQKMVTKNKKSLKPHVFVYKRD